MAVVGRAEHGERLVLLVRLPDLLDFECGDHEAFRVAQGEAAAGLEGVRELAGDVEGHRNWPQGAVGKAHVGQHPVVVRLAEKTFQRREGAVQQQLDIAELALVEVDGRVAQCLLPGLRNLFARQIRDLEGSTMRLDQFHVAPLADRGFSGLCPRSRGLFGLASALARTGRAWRLTAPTAVISARPRSARCPARQAQTAPWRALPLELHQPLEARTNRAWGEGRAAKP
jgi:hypothetical protein